MFGYCIHARNHLLPDGDGSGDYSEGLVDYVRDLVMSGEYPYLKELADDPGVEQVVELANAHGRDPDRFRRNLGLLDGIEADLVDRRSR